MTIKLIVFDIDGVLTDGETRVLDLPLLEQLAAMNRAARNDATRPAVTICTGRPAPYVEALLQAIDGYLPGIFENGAGLYVPDGYHFLAHPELGQNGHMKIVRQRLEETLLRSGQAYFQPGKEHTLTLFATNPAETYRLAEQASTALGSLQEHVDLVFSVSCLNVLPRGMDKGKGIDFLASYTGYRPDEMLGVGDSDVDASFLAAVGYSAAPANAIPAIKALAHYVAPRPTSAGVRDILQHFRLH